MPKFDSSLIFELWRQYKKNSNNKIDDMLNKI